MARPAKTPRVGTLIAIPLLALSCAAATSAFAQTSQVTNTQIQLGDVFSEQELDVVTAVTTTVATTATGNSVLGSVASGSANVTSTQTLSGSVTAQTVLNVDGYAGDTATMVTAATGNTADSSIEGGGALTGTFVQTTTQAGAGTGLIARGQVEAALSEVGDMAVSTQAIINSVGFGVTASTSDVTTTQTSNASALADGGAIMQYISGTASVSGAAVGNNLTAVGVDASSQTLRATQTNTGALTQASQFTAYGNSQDTVTAATATGNNINASNEGLLLDVTANQSNTSYVRAQAEETSFEFGGGAATAYGVGNSTLAGNFGPEIRLNNTQVNAGGGVEAIASFSGDTGYDAYSSATAMGNAATGYACSSCTGLMSVSNHQTNNADVGARSTTTLTGGARYVTSTSTAVGNNGSFYVSAPGGP